MISAMDFILVPGYIQTLTGLNRPIEITIHDPNPPRVKSHTPNIAIASFDPRILLKPQSFFRRRHEYLHKLALEQIMA